MRIYPNKENRCAQNHDEVDVLEVYITNVCNAKCKWCFDKNAYHPSGKTDYKSISEKILSFNYNTILLTGGEPTLYPDIKKLIDVLVENGKKIDMTTNGSKINSNFIENLKDVTNLTISIHHFDLQKNRELTGVRLDKMELSNSIKKLQEFGVSIRLNCTVTLGYLDTIEDIYEYIDFGKKLGVNSIRFAEVAYYDELFVDLNKIFNSQYGLTDEPFVNGCYKSAVINEMPVDIKLSCGALTKYRKFPDGAKTDTYKNIVYYDGEAYKGWQSSYVFYEEKTIDNILDDLMNSKISKEKATKYLSL